MEKAKVMENLAKAIFDWCKKHECWEENIIYFNGKAWSDSRSWGGTMGVAIGENLYEYADKNPLEYFEYANPKTLSMSFEGFLYDVLNGYDEWTFRLQDSFYELLKEHGYYYELGNSWNLSLYEI